MIKANHKRFSRIRMPDRTVMRLTIQMKARPEKARELDQTLHALLPAIRNAKGCRSCRLCRDLEDAEVFFLEVDWDERASLELFIPSPRGGALLGAIDLLSEAPRIKIGNDVWMGMEFLKKIRKQKKS
ncbi:MAG: antibiotic biosynthesis monooxygenase family protein [Syntrophaceae bacterium]